MTTGEKIAAYFYADERQASALASKIDKEIAEIIRNADAVFQHNLQQVKEGFIKENKELREWCKQAFSYLKYVKSEPRQELIDSCPVGGGQG